MFPFRARLLWFTPIVILWCNMISVSSPQPHPPRPLILIDRDGVINDPSGHYYVLTSKDFILYPSTIAAFQLLETHHIPWAIVTNQGGVGRGVMTEHDLEKIHEGFCSRLKEGGISVSLQQFFCCTDNPDTSSDRRKPNPTMLKEAMAMYHSDPAHTHMIGDDIRDLEAAFRAGVHRHLVLTGHGEKTRLNPKITDYAPVAIHANLLEAVFSILNSADASISNKPIESK